jgi:hypothetical protein
MKGYIYKLNDGTLTYYGSTTKKPEYRLGDHKRGTKCRTNKMNMNLIELTILEELEYENKDELLWLERDYIDKNECINIQKPIYSKEELEQNKITENERHKRREAKYRTSEKGKIQREKLKTNYLCECGKTLTLHCKNRHEKTKYHLNRISI